jgi:SAM-dependent methyltransferase
LSDAEHRLSIQDVREEAAWVAFSGRVLDLGCGTGAVVNFVPANARYLGIDPDARARGALIDRYPHASCLPSIAHVAPDVEPFDALISYHAIEHMHDPVGTLHAALALCRPGARVVISTPDFDSPAARKYGSRYRLLHDHTHISLFSLAGLLDMLNDLGVDVDHVKFPFRGTRWERAAREWRDTGDNYCPPAPRSLMSVYGVKR